MVKMTRAELIEKIRKAVGGGKSESARDLPSTTLFFVKGQAAFDLAMEYLTRALGAPASDRHQWSAWKWSIETSAAGTVEVITWDPVDDDSENIVDVSYPLQVKEARGR